MARRVFHRRHHARYLAGRWALSTHALSDPDGKAEDPVVDSLSVSARQHAPAADAMAAAEEDERLCDEEGQGLAPREPTLSEMMASLRAGAAAYKAEMDAMRTAIQSATSERDAVMQEVTDLVSDVQALRHVKSQTQAEVKSLEGDLRRAELDLHSALLDNSASTVLSTSAPPAGTPESTVAADRARLHVGAAAEQLCNAGYFTVDNALPAELANRVREYVVSLHNGGLMEAGKMRGGRTGHGEVTLDRERRGDLMRYVGMGDCPEVLEEFFAYTDRIVVGLQAKVPDLQDMTLGAFAACPRVC